MLVTRDICCSCHRSLDLAPHSQLGQSLRARFFSRPRENCDSLLRVRLSPSCCGCAHGHWRRKRKKTVFEALQVHCQNFPSCGHVGTRMGWANWLEWLCWCCSGLWFEAFENWRPAVETPEKNFRRISNVQLEFMECLVNQINVIQALDEIP